MLVGDLLQIPPVSGGLVFTVPKKSKNKVAHDLFNLWELFEPFMLKYNHRLGDGCICLSFKPISIPHRISKKTNAL